MKKLLLFVVGLGLLALLVETDFCAYFSDADSVSANTFQAGIVDIQLGEPVWMGTPEPNIDPGDTIVMLIPVENVGSLPCILEVSTDIKGKLGEAVQEHIEISPSTFSLDVGASMDVRISVTLPTNTARDYEGQGGMLFVKARAGNEGFFDEERTRGHAFASRREPPHVEIVSPVEGEKLSDVITVRIHTRDNFTIDHAIFYLDGQEIGKETSPPYTITWDIGDLNPGKHVLQVEVYDGAGNGASDSVWIRNRDLGNGDLDVVPLP